MLHRVAWNRFAQSNHPIFQLEVRALRDTTEPVNLRLRALRYLLLALVGALLFWVGWIVAHGGLAPYPLRGGVYSLSIEAVMILVGFGLVMGLFIDFSALVAGLGSINRDVVAGRWDLYRMTPYEPLEIVAAKHAALQFRVWRAMALTVSVRIAAVMFGGIHIAFITYDYRFGANRTMIDDIILGLTEQSLLAVLVAAALLLLTALYLIEPVWRMPAMLAMALSVSARPNTISALLAGLGYIVGVWISQAVIIFVVMMASLQAANVVFEATRLSTSHDDLATFLGFCFVVAGVLLLCVIAALYYRAFQRNRLQAVVQQTKGNRSKNEIKQVM